MANGDSMGTGLKIGIQEGARFVLFLMGCGIIAAVTYLITASTVIEVIKERQAVNSAAAAEIPEIKSDLMVVKSRVDGLKTGQKELHAGQDELVGKMNNIIGQLNVVIRQQKEDVQ